MTKENQKVDLEANKVIVPLKYRFGKKNLNKSNSSYFSKESIFYFEDKGN
jgi:hypothetical protein